MNEAFGRLLAASDDERRDAFLTTARRLGTAVQNVEKDFWVCWTLDVLFNGRPENHPRLLFKGGNVTFEVVRLDQPLFRGHRYHGVSQRPLGEPASIQELEALSGKKRRARLDAIKAACQIFINGPFRQSFTE